MRTPRKATPKTIRFGRNLARLRTQAGLTQEALAEKAGISTRYVQDLEAGLYSPTIWIVESLRKALKASWLDVLRGLGKPEGLEEPSTPTNLLSAQPAFTPRSSKAESKGKKPKA